MRDIVDLCSKEKQYFLECWKNRINGNNIIDAGAYTGDTVRGIILEKIRPENIYCFEADHNNFTRLEHFKNEQRISNMYRGSRKKSFGRWAECNQTR